MERGGVGVGGRFPLLLALVLCAGRILPLFSLNALQLPGPFSCGGYSSRWLIHIIHLVIALSTGVGLGNRNMSGCAPGGDRSGVWLGSD